MRSFGKRLQNISQTHLKNGQLIKNNKHEFNLVYFNNMRKNGLVDS